MCLQWCDVCVSVYCEGESVCVQGVGACKVAHVLSMILQSSMYLDSKLSNAS